MTAPSCVSGPHARRLARAHPPLLPPSARRAAARPRELAGSPRLQRRLGGGSAARRGGAPASVCIAGAVGARRTRSHSDDSYRLQPQCSLASVRCDHLRCGVCNCRKSIARRNPPIALQRFSFTIVTKQGANAGVATGRLRPAAGTARSCVCPLP